MSESVADHFAEQADSQPDAPALFWDGRAISYGELREMADAAHAELEALGLPADRPVGIQARKSPEAIALILACLRARRPFLLPSIELCASAESALEGADAAILVTEWPEFAKLDWEALRATMATPLVIDGRNFLDPERLRDAGFAYEGIGRSDGAPETGDTREQAQAETAKTRSR